MENVKGYEITRSVLFDNDRGIALGHNPKAPAPFVTWQFTQEGGKRDYYWGHYQGDEAGTLREFQARAEDYQKQFGVKVVQIEDPSLYKYYSTQRPIDLGTFPKPSENKPVVFINYDKRRPVEGGAFRAWGELLYAKPLTPEQIGIYELRPSPGNPDLRRRMEEQAQEVGRWEDAEKLPEGRRLTRFAPGAGTYALKDKATPEKLAACVEHIGIRRLIEAEMKRRRGAPSIAAQLTEGADRAARENADHPAPEKDAHKER